MSARIIRQCSDAWHYMILPALAALMPWKLAIRMLRIASRSNAGAFDESATAAVASAPRYIPIADPKAFAAAVRLNWLIDTTDLYTSLLRRKRSTMLPGIEQVGHWPADSNFIAVGFHYGNGLCVFRSLAAAGRNSTLVSARWERREFAGVPVRYWYGRMRGGEAGRLAGSPVVYRPGVRQQLADTIRRGNVLVSVLDMPPRLAPRGQRPVRLLDRRVSFPDGTLELAREHRIPIVPFWTMFEPADGSRKLVIDAPIDASDPAALQTLGDRLTGLILAQPASWYFWPELDRWIEDAEPVWRDGEPPAG